MALSTTVVHLREPHDVRIDRRTPWGNPFTWKSGPSLAQYRVGSRAEAIFAYRKWVRDSEDPAAAWIREHVHELRGKRLGCWCGDKPCHGRVLVELAEGLPPPVEQPSFSW